MKRFVLICVLLVSASFVGGAQVISDAVRYSQMFQTGTARFNSMGGAFSALGGDPSSLHQNPAGLGVYRSSEFSLTPMVYSIKSESSFRGSFSTDFLSDFDVAQLGVIIASPQQTNNGLVALNFGYSYNKTNIYGFNSSMRNTSNRSSIVDSWMEMANGVPYDALGGVAGLAFQTWLIDTLPGVNNRYAPAYSDYGNTQSRYGQTMRRNIKSDGYTSEHAFSLGANISNQLYVGATLGINVIDYYEGYSHMEQFDVSSDYNRLSSFTYNSSYSSSGVGVNFKIGAIYKPVESLRLSMALHTPTAYRIEDTYTDNMTSYFLDPSESFSESNDTYVYKYKYRTPGRVMVGAAYQFGNFGLVSVDYELINYAKSLFKMSASPMDYQTDEDYYADLDYFDELNGEINDALKLSNNIRVGAEFRVSKLYLRGGYAYYGCPWGNQDYLNYGKGYNSVSAGIGVRMNAFFMDFGYTAMFNNQTYMLYSSAIDSPLTDIDFTKNVFSFSLGFKF